MELRQTVFEGFRTDKAAAQHFGVSPAYMSAVLNDKKPVSERIAKMLGYELRWVRSSAKV
jgi:hypothetical protein